MSGVMHASGVLRDAMVAAQYAGGVREVVGAKVSGAVRLMGATQTAPLESAVMFSSIAALMGSAGQANYSGANAALDQRASAERLKGTAHCSVQWGAWSAGGMAMKDSGVLARIERMGLGALSPAQVKGERESTCV